MSTSQHQYLPKILVLAIVFSVFAAGFHALIGLYSDGSRFLYEILVRKDFFDPDKPRELAVMLLQLPVVTAVKMGVRDINTLIKLHTFGLLVWPLVFWLAALIQQFRSKLFWFIALAFCVTYLCTGFFAVGEYSLAYAACALCVATLLRPTLGWLDNALLFASALLLTHTYESMVFMGPLLATACILRAIRENDLNKGARAAVLISALLFLIGAGLSAWSILHPRVPANLAHAARVGHTLKSGQFIYAFVSVSLYTLLMMCWVPRWHKGILAIGCLMAALFLAFPHAWFSPASHYQSRALSALMLFGTLSAAIYDFFFGKASAPHQDATTQEPYPAAAILILMVSLCIPYWSTVSGFSAWARDFENASAEVTGIVPLDKTAIFKGGNAYEGYFWDWTTATLSMLLRGENHGVIVDTSGFKGQRNLSDAVLNGAPLQGYQKSAQVFN
jgi:MFS family permease